MALIKTEFDTKTKKLIVTLNGRTIDNVSVISIYTYGEGDKQMADISLSTRQQFEDEKLSITTTIYASKAEENSLNIDDLETYVNNQIDKTQDAVTNWLDFNSKK